MSRSLTSAAAAGCLAALAATPALAIDEFFPTFGNSGYDVRTYDVALDVDPVKNTLSAVARIDLVAERPLGAFAMDLAGLTVSRVTIDGVAAAFSQADDKLRITAPFPIRRGNAVQVTVTYAGKPKPIQDPTAPGDPDYVLGWQHDRSAIYAVSEPVGASTFYPANDEPTDRATFRFAITVDSPFTAVANGDLKGVAVRGNRRTFTWVMNQPMTTWLATVHVNRFRQSTVYTADHKPIRVFSAPGAPASDATGFLKAKPMIAWLEPLIGPYPFAAYGSVTVDDPALYYALENQGMSTFPSGASDEEIVVHELAHQWFGDSVSVAAWRDLWLAEGFATYVEVLWPHRNDAAGFDAAMAALYRSAKASKLKGAVVDAPEDIFSDRTYVRGALALYALRQTVGDDTFFKILRSWTNWFRNSSVTSQDFIETAVFVAGDPSLRTALTAWLYEDALPALPSGAAGLSASAASAALPDIVALRCGTGRAHRPAPASCAR